MGPIELMRMGRLQLQRLGLACTCLLLFEGVATSLLANPRPAVPPYPELALYYQRFENLVTNREGNVAISELTTNQIYLKNCDLLESWSGYSIGLSGNKVAYCFVPSLTGPKKNFSPVEGAIRFWVRPYWSSTIGPGEQARLLTISEVSEHPNAGWALQVNPEGTRLRLIASAAGESEDLISFPIDWSAGAWIQIGVTYSASNDFTGLVVNGQMVATGKGMGPMDRLVSLEKWGIFLGGDERGRHLAASQFDELTTFQKYQRVSDYAWNYQCLAGYALLGPITEAEIVLRKSQWLARTSSGGLTGGGVMAYSADPPWSPEPGNTNSVGTNYFSPLATNGLRLTFPFYTNSQWHMSLLEAETNQSYDIYNATNLIGDTYTNTFWMWVRRLQPGETNFAVTPAGFMHEYFLAGTTYTLSGHVLPYAYERLVSRGNSDVNGNGFADWWEFANFNRLLSQADVNSDPDRDGASNLQEFQAGSDSQNPGSVSNLLTANWHFDTTNWLGNLNQSPTFSQGCYLTNGASSNALFIAAGLSNGVVYTDLNPNGTALLNCQQGSARFWIQPRWSGTLSNMVLLQTGSDSNLWQLGITGNGSLLYLLTSQNGTNMTNVATTISWSNSFWHQVVLTYNTNSSKLYLDATLVATNVGVSLLPSITNRAQGLIVGNDWTGTKPLRAVLDELELFNYPFDIDRIQSDYWSVKTNNLALDEPPSITLTNPLANAQLQISQDIQLAASATDNDGAISQVQFFQGTNSLGIVTNAPYVLAWPIVPAGSYALTAQAKDNLGVVSTSAVINITVNLAPDSDLDGLPDDYELNVSHTPANAPQPVPSLGNHSCNKCPVVN